MEVHFRSVRRKRIGSKFKTLWTKSKANRLKSLNKEILEAVKKLQRAYYGYDPVVSTFNNTQLISNIDLICRAFSISLTRPNNKDYILSKLSGASYGIYPNDRKVIFIEKNLHIGNEVSYWDNKGHSSFYFCSYRSSPYLLIRHKHGMSVMNATEEVLESIQKMYIEELGFHLVKDKVSILVKDDRAYYKVEVDAEFTNPKWDDLSVDEQAWFNDQWEHLNSFDGGLDDNSPMFFGNDRPYTAYKHIRRLFKRTTKELFVIDPYINEDVFSMFEIIPASVMIRLITSNYQGDSLVIAKRFRRERGNFDFRKSRKLHDRYLFCDNHCYLFGSSLNNFGSLPTTIVPIHDKELGDSVMEYFDSMWNECSEIK
ncbi:phospholipase D family protein [Sulfoacidibacillus ferrooxidans]|uniref:Uncharacterized protein n=1 Tax=Sulfoacidibacillus ferrooxidans TaxID=2005001 RepID=A0A9X1VAE6_9BACL|nr:phospholipase D family protein [Sulfoacidibacillus ferrooxidans]MCI0184611.1 hypothetical protein [Sulfoacidibacillus ferrooxidans]